MLTSSSGTPLKVSIDRNLVRVLKELVGYRSEVEVRVQPCGHLLAENLLHHHLDEIRSTIAVTCIREEVKTMR